MIRAAIFDLDGVVVDTARYHYLAWRSLARRLGFRFTEQQNERLKGVSRMRSLEILLEVGGLADRFSEAEKAQMAAEKNADYQTYISRMTPDEILPGALAFLHEVRADGLRTALGSASRNAPLILERTGLAPLFDVVVDGSMVGEAKPDPEVFLLGAERLGVPPAECVVFEDAEAGIEAARRAGMRSVGVGSPERLGAADRVIPNFVGQHWNELKITLPHG